MKRAKDSLKKSVNEGKPFFLYFNHSLMHMPVIPRAEFKGRTGFGDWSDSLLELDSDFGTLLDYLTELGVADNTIVVFSGDNGPEDTPGQRGTAGFFEGSYFAGSEGNLHTPALVRYPGKVPAGQVSNVPKPFNLRVDPFERGDESFLYEWLADRAFIAVPAQALVAQWLDTFKEFPMRQKPASFNLDSVMEKASARAASTDG